MNTAVFTSAFAGETQTPSKLSALAKSIVDALVESRARSAARELRRHEAFLSDLGRRQDHSPLFLIQDNALPFKV
ncbi:hypothetical protein [Microvirga roseola]|uniref:hypothetical protein n=1 Tax=Microvirga roseola TaxID=2883126 RepID=UPI001E5ED5CC|nr:hypothetical protein [Microvirga roseola]